MAVVPVFPREVHGATVCGSPYVFLTSASLIPSLTAPIERPGTIVGGIEGAPERGQEGKGALRLQAPFALEEAPEIDALDVAHGDEEDAARLVGVVDGDDVGVVEGGGDARLAQEALAEALVLGQLGGEQLERHLASEAQVLGAVDDAHAAAPEQGLDPVAGQGGADAGVGLD